MVQLSHLYMTTGKTIALNTWAFVSKMMSLHFNMLFRFVLVGWPLVILTDQTVPWTGIGQYIVSPR